MKLTVLLPLAMLLAACVAKNPPPPVGPPVEANGKAVAIRHNTICLPPESPVVQRLIAWPPAPDREFDLAAKLRLEARLEGDPGRQPITVKLFNEGALPARVWQTWNSWGAGTLSLEVRAKDADKVYSIVNAVCAWTMNFPSTHEIEPGSSIDDWINPYDGYSWRVPKECWKLEGPVEFRARWQIGPSDDQLLLKVTTCNVYSPWVVSEKPRAWLPDHETGNALSVAEEKK